MNQIYIQKLHNFVSQRLLYKILIFLKCSLLLVNKQMDIALKKHLKHINFGIPTFSCLDCINYIR